MSRLDWSQREQLILEAIRDLEDEHVDEVQNMHIEEATGLDEADVGLGLQTLMDDDYVRGTTYGGNTPGVDVKRRPPRPEGEAAAEAVAEPQDARDALLQALDDALERTDDPEQRSAIEQTKRGVLALAGKVTTELAIALAKRASGLDG